jgi:hypothetical protein
MESALLEQHKTNQKDMSGWPDDWYVYDGEKVRGPLSAKETFSPSHGKKSGQKSMVSRKGFSQWYDLRDLSAIFNLTTAMDKKVEAERARLEKTENSVDLHRRVKLQPAQTLRPKDKRFESGSHPRSTGAAVSSKQQVSRRHVGKGLTTSLAKPVVQPQAGLSTKEPASLMLQLSPADIDFSPPEGLQPSHVEGKKPGKSWAKKSSRSKNSWMRDYIYAKNHLRLGEIRQPWITGLLTIPLTLGTFWVIWFRDLSLEIAAHTSSQSKSRSYPYWWSAFPLVHILMIYRLARSVREMEEENRYANTIPWLAALLGLFPPLATVYLQSAANRHWFLHVRHVKTNFSVQSQM